MPTATRVGRRRSGLAPIQIVYRAPRRVRPARAETAATSQLVSAEAPNCLLAQAGFTIRYDEDRTPLILQHHQRSVAETAAAGPAPLGVHMLLGANATETSRNMIRMAEAGQIGLGLFIAAQTGPSQDASDPSQR